MKLKGTIIAILLLAMKNVAAEFSETEIADDIQNSADENQKNIHLENECVSADLSRAEETCSRKSDELQEGNVTDASSDLQLNYVNLNDNAASKNDANSSTSNTSFPISCLLNKTHDGLPVEIVNATRLVSLLHTEPNITSRQVPANCSAVLFYSPRCPFSCSAAPHFNALPRIFPDIKMAAIDAMMHHSFNVQYGIVGVPTLILFHNGRPVARFNETSEYGLEMFAKFITKCTGLEPKGKLVVTSADFGGPIHSVPIKERDPWLFISWLFIIVCAVYFFFDTTWYRWLFEATLSAWREAEAQHFHAY